MENPFERTWRKKGKLTIPDRPQNFCAFYNWPRRCPRPDPSRYHVSLTGHFQGVHIVLMPQLGPAWEGLSFAAVAAVAVVVPATTIVATLHHLGYPENVGGLS